MTETLKPEEIQSVRDFIATARNRKIGMLTLTEKAEDAVDAIEKLLNTRTPEAAEPVAWGLFAENGKPFLLCHTEREADECLRRNNNFGGNAYKVPIPHPDTEAREPVACVKCVKGSLWKHHTSLKYICDNPDCLAEFIHPALSDEARRLLVEMAEYLDKSSAAMICSGEEFHSRIHVCLNKGE